MILYNVPGRTVADLANETVLRLAEVPGIVGHQGRDRGPRSRQRAAAGASPRRPHGDFAVYSGEDITALPLMLMGGHGVISVTANVAPRLMAQMCAAALAGDVARRARCNDRLLAAASQAVRRGEPDPVKWALAEMGLIDNELRLPLVPLSPQFHETVRAALREAGVSRVRPKGDCRMNCIPFVASAAALAVIAARGRCRRLRGAEPASRSASASTTSRCPRRRRSRFRRT